MARCTLHRAVSVQANHYALIPALTGVLASRTMHGMLWRARRVCCHCPRHRPPRCSRAHLAARRLAAVLNPCTRIHPAGRNKRHCVTQCYTLLKGQLCRWSVQGMQARERYGGGRAEGGCRSTR